VQKKFGTFPLGTGAPSKMRKDWARKFRSSFLCIGEWIHTHLKKESVLGPDVNHAIAIRNKAMAFHFLLVILLLVEAVVGVVWN
jgi:hypothetical protein